MRQQAIIWNSTEAIHWRIYVALRGDELNAIEQDYFTQLYLDN